MFKKALLPLAACVAVLMALPLDVMAQRYPRGVTGSFVGTEVIANPQGQPIEIPTRLFVSRGAGNLRIVSFQIINGQHVVTQSILRRNGQADAFKRVNGVIVASGTGRFSRRGNRVLNLNVALTDSTGITPFNQRLTVRGTRVTFRQSDPARGFQSFLLGNRLR